MGRAALDAARRLPDRNEVRSLLAEVVQRGRCSPAELHTELADGSGRGTKLPREVLVEISDGVRSVGESRRATLPTKRWVTVALIDTTCQLLAGMAGVHAGQVPKTSRWCPEMANLVVSRRS